MFHPTTINAPGRAMPLTRPAIAPPTHAAAPMAGAPHTGVVGPSLYAQRASAALPMIRQRLLAEALRGGSATGSPAAPPSLGITRPQGLPTFK